MAAQRLSGQMHQRSSRLHSQMQHVAMTVPPRKAA